MATMHGVVSASRLALVTVIFQRTHLPTVALWELVCSHSHLISLFMHAGDLLRSAEHVRLLDTGHVDTHTLREAAHPGVH